MHIHGLEKVGNSNWKSNQNIKNKKKQKTKTGSNLKHSLNGEYKAAVLSPVIAALLHPTKNLQKTELTHSSTQAIGEEPGLSQVD